MLRTGVMIIFFINTHRFPVLHRREGIMKTVLFILLGCFEAFVALGAFFGGWNLMTDPTGSSMQMSSEWLKRSPFHNYLIPGIVLFSVNGLGSLVASILSFMRKNIAGWLGIGFGAFLFLWICVQVYYMGLTIFLQPMYGGIGLVELLLGIIILKISK